MMKRHSVRWLLLLALMLLLPCQPAVSGSDELAGQTKQLKQLRTRIDALKNKLGSLRGQQSALQQELEQTEKAIGSSAATLRQLDQGIDQSQVQLQALATQRQEQREKLRGMRGDLARDLRQAYFMGNQEQVKLLLNQEDPATVGRMLAYHGYFTRARAGRMQAIHAVLEELTVIEQAAIEQKLRLEKLRLRQHGASIQLETRQSQRKAVLAKLQAELKEKSASLTTLERDEQQLQALVQSLQEALRDIMPAAGTFKSLRTLKGKLSWPVAGRISMTYGTRQVAGKPKSRGVLVSAPGGTDVRAIFKGRVVFADWLRGFGLMLIIEHGDGYMSLYGRNRSLFREVGDWVEAGDVVATVGNSGGQQSAGLYLELRKDGRPFNPAPWFAGQPSAQHAGR